MIDSQSIVGVLSDDDFRRYQPKHNSVLFADIENAQFAEYKNSYYMDDWLRPLQERAVDCVHISIVRIEEDEYNALIKAFETEEEAAVNDVVYNGEVEQVKEITQDVSVEFVKSSKIKEISTSCQQIISGGFDVVLGDGETHHFSLTVEDQLNLITLSTMIGAGEQAIPYHEDGKICVFYTAEDATRILTAATEFKTYHITYFNSLKYYINSLTDIPTISNISYGIQIPQQYQSLVLKNLNGSANE